MKSRNGRVVYPLVVLFLLLNVLVEKVYAINDGTSSGEYKKEYSFTTDWFSEKIPLWTRILAEFKEKNNITYLQIGAFEGRSALWLQENILTSPTAKLILVDTFQEDSYKTLMSNIDLSGENSKFKILLGLSTDKLKELLSNSIDFVYIDGSGKGIVMLSDLVNTWNLVKLDGIIICSRYSLDKELRERLELQPQDPGPQEAIAAFLQVYKPYIKVLESEEDQIIFRKIRE